MTARKDKLNAEIDRLLIKAAEALTERRMNVVAPTHTLMAALPLAKLMLNLDGPDADIEVQSWEQLHPKAKRSALGYIPGFISMDNDDDLRTQLDRGYSHAGGYRPIKAMWRFDPVKYLLTYPGEPSLHGLWRLRKGEEEVVMFEREYVMVRNLKSQDFEVARMD